MESIEALIAKAWWSLEAWDLDSTRESVANALDQDPAPPLAAQAEVLLSRADLLTAENPRQVELSERCRQTDGGDLLAAAILRFEVERALAAGMPFEPSNQSVFEIDASPDRLAVECLRALMLHRGLPPQTESPTGLSQVKSSWAHIFRAFQAEARGRSGNAHASEAITVAKKENSLSAHWVALLARAEFSRRRKAYREERKAQIEMAEMLEAWLLTLAPREAKTAMQRPDRIRFLTAEMTPVAESARLVKLALEMAKERELSPLVELALDAAVSETQAERAVLLLRDDLGGHRIAGVRHVEREVAQHIQLSSTVARTALEKGEVVVSNDVTADARFTGLASLEFGITSILCVPIRARANIEGAIYLDRRAGGLQFDESAIAAAEAVGALLASSLLSAKTLALLETRQEQLNQARMELAQALRTRSDENERMRERLGEVPASNLSRLLGQSFAMERLREMIRRVALSDAPVLIHGETGTGKELVARAIHDQSLRREKPFLAINCAAMSESLVEAELFGAERGAYTNAATSREGLFEAAHGGSLLLDEVGDMSNSMQVALLRVLETGEVRRIGATKSRKVDVRIIAASHKSLEEEVAKNLFRADLRYRLEVVKIEVPALRDHLEDLPELADALLSDAERRYALPARRLSTETLEALKRRNWSGNVRQLRHVLASAALLAVGREITPECLPPENPSVLKAQAQGTVFPVSSFGQNEPNEQVLAIRRALAEASGNRSQAAKLLGISRATFYRYIELLGIDPKAV